MANPGVETTINFSDSEAFTFDAEKIEFAEGKAKLKKVSYPNEAGYYNFNTDDDLDPIRGAYSMTLVGVPSNTATVSGGKLNFVDSNQSRAVLSKDILDPTKGTIHFKFTPNFADTTLKQYIFSVFDPTLTNPTLIELSALHSALGGVNFSLIVKDSSGSTVFTQTKRIDPLVAGQEYDMKLCYDFVAGNSRFFLDGVQGWESSATATMTFGASHTFQIGEARVHIENADFSIDDLQISNIATESDDTGFAVPVAEFKDYPNGDSSNILSDLPMYMSDLIAFDSAETKLEQDEIKYQMKYRGNAYYIVDNVATISDGSYAQSNTLAEIQASLALGEIDISPDSPVQMITLLHADDGYSTPEIESMTLGYGFYFESSEIPKCVVSGTVLDNNGLPVSGAIVEFDSLENYFYGEHLIAKKAVFTTDDLGQFYAQLIETETTAKTVNCKISYTENGKTVVDIYPKLTIPNLANEEFQKIVADSKL